MIKIIALLALANAVNYYVQEGPSADPIDETRTLFCVYNGIENKEMQFVDLGFEGLAEPKARLSI